MSDIGNKEIMARNLSRYVERSGKSQKELSEIVGVATSTFNDWMKAKKYPRIDKIEILANYFGILKSDLIEDKTEDHRRMQENNDIITDAVIRMRMDSEFFSVVEYLLSLERGQLEGVRQMLSAFQK